MIQEESIENFSEFQKWRQKYTPNLPQIYQNFSNSAERSKLSSSRTDIQVDSQIQKLFPTLFSMKPSLVEISKESSKSSDSVESPLRVGVVLSGGQAPGGHNVIAGIYDSVKAMHINSQVFGFLGGPKGIFTNKYTEINDEFMHKYRNQGGFDMICSGRDKIEKEDQFENSLKYCKALKLDGLVVIGGDDSNTNACLLAEYFAKNGAQTKVIGIPKTIDGDLKNEYIEVSFGFDTATRVYSSVIGNLCLDALSSKKYYHFIRLMGRSATHIALECCLLTQSNCVLIGEEVEAKKQTLEQLTHYVCDIISKRADLGKNYGIILVPEGLVEFVPEVNALIKQINEILPGMTFDEKLTQTEKNSLILKELESKMSSENWQLLKFLPRSIVEQLMLDRDSHGNVQVSKIDTERLLILLCEKELARRNHKFKFTAQSHFFGYEGRSALPSFFDAEYCYSLGYNAGYLIQQGLTGYMSVIRGLKDPDPQNWRPAACPLMSMMNIERRKGKDVPVIKKALVELEGDMFKFYEKVRDIWALNDAYITPGPMQYEGPTMKSCPYLVHPPDPNSTELSKYAIPEESKSTPYAPKSMSNTSRISNFLMNLSLELPKSLNQPVEEVGIRLTDTLHRMDKDLKMCFDRDHPEFSKYIRSNLLAEVVQANELDVSQHSKAKDLRIGIVYNGRQAPGGNNIVDGMLRFQKNSKSKVDLIGFKFGTLGLFDQSYIEITEENFKQYYNHGGFDYLGRSVDKIRTKDQIEKAARACQALDLDGLLLVGASHTLSDAILLTDHFLKSNIKTAVIGVPCTVDGNVSHPYFEQTVGFDTASKVYSELIGNIMTDSASATKYWYFIRLMGRDPSHLVLECALQTHPNYVIISEECAQRGQNLNDIVSDICDVIVDRANQKKNFGCVLIPEGLLSYLSYFKGLIEELNNLLADPNNKKDIEEFIDKLLNDDDFLKSKLSPWSTAIFLDMPEFIRRQLLTERESGGSIQLSQIETERLISHKVALELERRKLAGKYKGGFSAITHFFGYQGRCSQPSLFDARLASTYGYTACLLIKAGLTGYCTTAKGVAGGVENWKIGGIPLSSMSKLKSRSQYGENKTVIPSSEVSLGSNAFLDLQHRRRDWVKTEHYCNPGPIQYYQFGRDTVNMTLKLNHQDYGVYLDKIERLCDRIKSLSKFGAKEEVLQLTCINLESLEKLVDIMHQKDSI